jgi:hypothetical protein
VAFVVLVDACVLHQAPVRDLLIRIANTGIVRARWSERILDECIESIARRRPDISPESLDRTRRLMCDAVPDCIVTGFEHLEAGLEIPDTQDRHVLAAAIRAGAQALVTFNLKHFPDHALARYDIDPKHPDEFVLESIDLSPTLVVQCVHEQANALKNPPQTVQELLDTLRRHELVRSVARLRELLLDATSGRPG